MSIPPEDFTFGRQDRVIELLKLCTRAVDQGMDRVVLMKTTKRAPKNFDRVLVLPGVYGKIIGGFKAGQWAVSVEVAPLVAALERVMGVGGKRSPWVSK